jgi:hypothetical protein
VGGVVGAVTGGAAAGAAEGAAVGAVAGAAAGGSGVLGSSSLSWRYLTGREFGYVSWVFGGTLPPMTDIVITDFAGINNRPFTIPGSLIPALAVAGIPAYVGALFAPTLLTKYLINLTPAGFRDALAFDAGSSKVAGQTLTHELTHVWQGYHSSFALSYVLDSVKNQIFSGNGAYDYGDGGAQWNTYNAEQQAHIVEDWFAQSGGLNVDDNNYFPFKGRANYKYIKLYRYIKFNIRAGAKDAPSPEPNETSPLAKLLQQTERPSHAYWQSVTHQSTIARNSGLIRK